MIKHLITATSFALGGPGLVLLGYLGGNRQAVTHPAQEPPSVTASPASTAAPLQSAIKGHITLADVLITASSPATPAERVLSARLDPCSEWSDVGAGGIDPAGVTGARAARDVCNKAGDQH